MQAVAAAPTAASAMAGPETQARRARIVDRGRHGRKSRVMRTRNCTRPSPLGTQNGGGTSECEALSRSGCRSGRPSLSLSESVRTFHKNKILNRGTTHTKRQHVGIFTP